MAILKRNLGEHEDYNPISLMRFHSREEMLSEYNRMKDVFRKRVATIKRSGEFEGAQIVSNYEEFKGRAERHRGIPAHVQIGKDAHAQIRLGIRRQCLKRAHRSARRGANNKSTSRQHCTWWICKIASPHHQPPISIIV